MTALIVLTAVFIYLASATHVLRRLAWHFVHDKGEFDRDGGYIGAFTLAILLPVGVFLLVTLDRSGGGYSFLLPPKSVRDKDRLEQLERENADYERRLGIS